MRILSLTILLSLCICSAAFAGELYAIQAITPGNSVVYPKRLRVLRELLPSLQAKAETGDAEAQRNLGEKLLMLDEKSEAGKWLRKSANQGNADALYLLGYLFLEERKTDEGAKWLEKAAGKGNTQACVALGDMYFTNRQDPARAFPYFKRGAEAGNAHAQHRLAICYSQGWGVKKDVKKSLEWLKKSAGNGFTEPMLMLFEIYSDPQPAKLCGVKTNPAKALYWLERAAAARAGSALFELFEIAEKGKKKIGPNAVMGWLWSQWALDAIENHDTENIFLGKKGLEAKAALFIERMNESERANAASTFKIWVENGYPLLSATEPQ